MSALRSPQWEIGELGQWCRCCYGRGAWLQCKRYRLSPTIEDCQIAQIAVDSAFVHGLRQFELIQRAIAVDIDWYGVRKVASALCASIVRALDRSGDAGGGAVRDEQEARGNPLHHGF